MPIETIQYRATIGVFNLSPRNKPKRFFNSGGTEINPDIIEGCRITLYTIFISLYLTSLVWNLTFSLITTQNLLSQCVDIHPHPGPNHDFGNLTFCHVNIRSIKAENRLTAFINQVKDKYDIISSSETWLTKNDKNDQFDIPGYSGPYRLDRTLQGGGGS